MGGFRTVVNITMGNARPRGRIAGHRRCRLPFHAIGLAFCPTSGDGVGVP
jgi:hypothetical protein